MKSKWVNDNGSRRIMSRMEGMEWGLKIPSYMPRGSAGSKSGVQLVSNRLIPCNPVPTT